MPTIKTKTAVITLILLPVNVFKLNRTPICPPIKTAKTNPKASSHGSSKVPVVIRPTILEIEFTKIKKLASAAILIDLSHFI